MPQVQFNVLAIITAIVLNMVLGFIYYHPKVFGNKWMNLLGKSSMDLGNANVGYLAMTFMSLLMALVMSVFISWTGATTVGQGALIGLLAWFGYAVPSNGASHVFEGKPWALLALNLGYHLISYVLIGAMLASWR